MARRVIKTLKPLHHDKVETPPGEELWTWKTILRVRWTERRKKPIKFGSETQKITRSNNPPIKATLFWSHYESKSVTGTEHYDWTSYRIQEAGKTTDELA
jgi:hypothetical protein